MSTDPTAATMLTQEDLAKLAEITRLLTEAYEHYFEHSDGYCKSAEGAISLDIPPFFWRDDVDKTISVNIYSYVLGPSRDSHFENIDAALEAVRSWHADEMAQVYDEYGDRIESQDAAAPDVTAGQSVADHLDREDRV